MIHIQRYGGKGGEETPGENNQKDMHGEEARRGDEMKTRDYKPYTRKPKKGRRKKKEIHDTIFSIREKRNCERKR